MPLHILFLNDKLKKNTLKLLGAWKSAYTRKRLVLIGQLQWLAQVVRVNSHSLCRVHLFRFMGGETKYSILDVLKAAVVYALTRTWLRTWTWTCPISSKLLSPNQNLTEKMTWTCCLPWTSQHWFSNCCWLSRWLALHAMSGWKIEALQMWKCNPTVLLTEIIKDPGCIDHLHALVCHNQFVDDTKGGLLLPIHPYSS